MSIPRLVIFAALVASSVAIADLHVCDGHTIPLATRHGPWQSADPPLGLGKKPQHGLQARSAPTAESLLR